MPDLVAGLKCDKNQAVLYCVPDVYYNARGSVSTHTNISGYLMMSLNNGSFYSIKNDIFDIIPNSYYISSTYYVPTFVLQPGQYGFRYQIDAENKINESNENNNIATSTVTIP